MVSAAATHHGKQGSALNRQSLRAGDADGLGETRKQELLKSGMLLGLRNEDDMLVIEDRCLSTSSPLVALHHDTR